MPTLEEINQNIQSINQGVSSLGASGLQTLSPLSVDTLRTPPTQLQIPQQTPDTNQYAGILNENRTITETKPEEMPAYMQNFLKGLEGSKPVDPTEGYNKLYGETIAPLQQEANNIKSKLAGINADYEAAKAQLEGAGIDKTEAFLKTNKAARTAALASLPLQAQLSLAEGNLSAAKDKFNNFFNMQSDYQDKLYNYNKEVRDTVFKFADEQQKLKLAEKGKLDDRKYAEQQNNLTYARTLVNAAIANGQGALATQIGQIDFTKPDAQAKLAVLAGQITRPLTAAERDARLSGLNNSIGKNPEYAGIVNTILGSGKFTKDQARAITNAINSGEDPFVVIRNNAKNIMGQTLATALDKNEQTRDAMIQLDSSLRDFYAAGGDSGIFKGNFEKVANKLGEVNDPNLLGLAVKISSSLQKYRNAISGTAYSEQEGRDIASIFPGINKGQALNSAIVKARLEVINSDIDSAYKNTLGSSYDNLKQVENQPVGDEVSSQYKETLDSILNQQLSTSPSQPKKMRGGGDLITGSFQAAQNLFNWLSGK